MVNMQPAGKYLGERFHRAGGVPAVLNELLELPAAMEYDPILVKRLKRLRVYRQRQRVARLLGAEYSPQKR